MRLSKFSKKAIAIVSAIALVAAGFAFAPSKQAIADDYSGLTYTDITYNQNTEFDQTLKGAQYAVASGPSATLNPILFQNTRFSELYIAGGGWSAANLQATINGVANSVTPEGAGLRCYNCADYFDRKYNEIDVTWDGGTAKIIIYCPLKSDPETSATESQSQTESQTETQTESTTQSETTTKAPTVLPDFPNLKWESASNMYTDVAYCVIEHTIKGWGNMNFYNTDYMQFIGSGDSKFNEADYEVLNSSGTDITSSVQPFEKGAAVVGVNLKQKLGSSDEYYLFTFDNPDTGRLQVAIRIGNPSGETTEPYTGETTTEAPQVPGVPVGLVANIVQNNTKVYVAHGPASGTVTGYKYYLDDVLDARFYNGSEVSLDGFNPGQTYTIKVTAYNDVGEGPAATKTFTVPYPAGWYDVTDYKAQGTYPTEAGKVFAGWFTDDTCTTPYTSTTGYAYAKFIDENVLSTKFQASNDGTAVRMLSSLDSKDYSQIGFNFTGTYDGDELDNWTKTATKIYKKINADGTEVEPTTFSSESKYFFTYTVRGLTAGKSLTLSVTPFFVTLDGTTVTGKSGTYPQS